MNPVQAKFATTRRELSASLIERDEEIDILLTSLICKQHPLLVGPPGTGKSMLADAVVSWMSGTKFSILLTKFTTPEEVFGPISIAGLKEDKYRRVTTGKLPEASIAFADEIFKASSAILNTMLKILNERLYDNGDGAQRVPLRICVAASNEWPNSQDGGKELGALFDRFLFRTTVKPIVSRSGRKRLLDPSISDHTPRLSTTLTSEELDQANRDAMALPWTDEAREALDTILRELANEGIVPGDRRQFQSIGAARAFAYLEGADKVRPEHLEILSHVLWDDPTEQPAKCAQIVAKIANPLGMRVNSLLLECEQILTTTDTRQLAQAAAATTKLGEIARTLAGLTGANGRAIKAREYVLGEIKRIKLATVDSF